MRRRCVLQAIGTGVGAVTTGIGGFSALGAPARAATISPLYFDSTTGLLDASGNPLTDNALVSVYAHDSARAVDSDDNGDATEYGSEQIALVATDRRVVAIGCPFLTDDTDFSFGNEEFILNVWDDLFDGGGTVLWDEAHDQYYDLDHFGTFQAYAESEGYTVESTTDLAGDLDRADGVVITTPTVGLSESELTALSDFVVAGGGVVLHSQSDYRNFDATATLNTILAELGRDLRFNDAQIMDSEHGPGPEYIITTDQFTSSHPYFGSRPGISAGPRFDITSSYEATVESIADGDTFEVSIADGREEVRVLGVDTPELARNAEFELPHEWPGLGDQASGTELDEDYPTLATWAENGREFAEAELAGETVTISFDENEGITDPFGRLLAYVHYDANGSGSPDTLFARRLLETGHARTYHSGTARHDEFLDTELSARDAGTGMWAESDLTESSAYRSAAVEEVFVPNPAPVTSESAGTISDARAIVRAESSASHAGSPLVVMDTESRVAVTGGLIVNDAYEEGSDFEGDVTQFDNFTLLTNILTALSDRDGSVLVGGGNGQFGAPGSLTAEATAFYQRHLEGVDILLEGVNELTTGHLDEARAVIITAPSDLYESEELDALTGFRDGGGGVILMGSASAGSSAVQDLNSIASELGTDLRVGRDSVTDPESNLAEDASLLVTSGFSDAVDLYAALEGTGHGGGTTNRSKEATPATSGNSGSGFGALTTVLGLVGGAAGLLGSRKSGD